MHSFAVGPNYRKIQPEYMTVDAAESDFPDIDTDILRAPEKIFVQAPSANTESVFIGFTGLDITTGAEIVFELMRGGSLYLPNHLYSKWKAISASGGQRLYVSYMAEVF